ncbi:methionyl-tRNA formyltransferase [Aureimonas fodinaquatilis]|uniref:Methionyl-tRNA formyltransferase n=1 Tax=Aureimonas fodinaquatilis TaxID=2565783 RepID=A0A5B0DZX6_9HYPH|nr:methionyl-tRNA formyltransferase [Aureimonas fodinaquatilis]KAA0972347.1 methionyl-tRNA formyltransferase [Aureimonas fodinaquatilis]
MALNVIFMGTPDFSVPTLRALHAAGHTLVAVYTQPPRPAGRGMAARPSPVEAEARRLGVEVRSPLSLKGEEEQQQFAALNADIAIVVAYGLLLPQPVLDAPRHGALNGHASLLPRWRGAAPIQRAVEAGDATTGMMIMRMEAGLDTGPVALTREVAIGRTETSGELHDRLAVEGAAMMVEALARLEAGELTFEDQSSIAARTGREPIYARKILKNEAHLDFTASAKAVAAKINGFSPFPGAFALTQNGERTKLLRALEEPGAGNAGVALDDKLLIGCGEGAVRLLTLQKQGGKPLDAAEFLRGQKIPAGTRFV